MKRAARPPVAWLGLAAALVALLALPGTAWGGGGRDLKFDLHGAHGYRIAVEAHGSTAVIAVSHRHTTARTVYMARAKVSATAVRADFAGLGRVAVRFHPSGKPTRSRPRRNCRGPDHYVTRRGFFHGAVDFDGEGGYTSAHVRQAKGTIVSPRSLDCFSGSFGGSLPGLFTGKGKENPHAKVAFLSAEAKSATGGTSLLAANLRGLKALYIVTNEQSEGQVAVAHIAFALASPLTFAFDNSLGSAGISPPAPFSGTATFQHNLDGTKAWTGPLAVSFPGAEVPLTGPQFTAKLTGSW